MILDEDQQLADGGSATIRVYISEAIKRTVVVKDTDDLNKKEIQGHAKEVGEATMTELKTWLTNNCFEIYTLNQKQQCYDFKICCQMVMGQTAEWSVATNYPHATGAAMIHGS